MTAGRAAAALIAALMLAGCGSTGQTVDIAPGETPDINTDEAGLWMRMERAETAILTSGRVVEDPALNAYVSDIICRLAPDHCTDLRIYVLRDSAFNATAGPNGALYVFSGLLLRAESESQLAYVLGHEIAHYTRRHSLQRWRDARAKTDAVAALQVLSAAAQVATGTYIPVGDAVAISMYGSIFAFSRENEREADAVGLRMMAEAGYSAADAAGIWEGLLAEREASDDSEPPLFFATHPAIEDRITALDALADDVDPARQAEDRHLRVIAPFRGDWLRDELTRRDFAATEVLLDRLAESSHQDGEIAFFQGELYRLRGEDGDDDRAVAAYRKAVNWGGAPPELHRSLGTVHYAAGRRQAARRAFERYLEEAPNAGDREMIRFYIDQIS